MAFPPWFTAVWMSTNHCLSHSHCLLMHLGTNHSSESESHSVVSNSLRPHGLYSLWNSPDQNTGMGSCFLPQGIFPTQESNLGLLHCKWIVYQLSHQRGPRILERVAYPFSRGSSQPRNQTRVSCIASGFFTSWVTREALTLFLYPHSFFFFRSNIFNLKTSLALFSTMGLQI